MLLRSTQILILCAAVTASLHSARGDSRPRLPQRAFVISPGLTLAGTSSLDLGTGFSLGGEISALYWQRKAYVGSVVDVLYDWNRGSGRSMVGAMLGFGPVGVDGGYLIEYGNGAFHGAGVRLFLSLGVIGAYVRYGALFEAPDFVEWGLLLKVPLQLWSVYRRPAAPVKAPQ